MIDRNPWADPATRADYEADVALYHRRRADLFADLAGAVADVATMLDHMLRSDRRQQLEREQQRAEPPAPAYEAMLAEQNQQWRERALAGGVAAGVLRQLADAERQAAGARADRWRSELRRLVAADRPARLTDAELVQLGEQEYDEIVARTEHGPLSTDGGD
jgi:hypothetical protein